MTDLFAMVTFPELKGLGKLGITGSALAVWMGFRIRGSIEGGECRPSQLGLAKELGLDYSTVKRAVKSLRDSGLLVEVGRRQKVVIWDLNLQRVLKASGVDRGNTAPMGEEVSAQDCAHSPDVSARPCTDKETDRGSAAPIDENLSAQGCAHVDEDRRKSAPIGEGVSAQGCTDRPGIGAGLRPLSAQPCAPNITRTECKLSTPTPTTTRTHGAEPPGPENAGEPPPVGVDVDSPNGEVGNPVSAPDGAGGPGGLRTPAEELRAITEHLLAQPWWMPRANARQSATERLLADYVRKWPPSSIWLWVTIATAPEARQLRRAGEGAFLFAHLRGYGRDGWNPETRAATERALHAAILRGDREATERALGLEVSYTPENRARAFREAGATAPAPTCPVPEDGQAAALDRNADEAAGCLMDIPGWMLEVQGADAFEKQRNRLAATRQLTGRLVVRCNASAIAGLLLALFRESAPELSQIGITPQWIQSALEAEALGVTGASGTGLQAEFFAKLIAGDFDEAEETIRGACLEGETG